MATDFEIVSFADRPDLIPEAERVGGAAWPEFMLHDPVAMQNWAQMIDRFAASQLMLRQDGQIIALANAVPLHFDGPLSCLPDRGVEWGVEKSLADHAAGTAPNALMGVQVVVAAGQQSKGFSQTATSAMLDNARRRGIERVIIPVRPANKHLYPLIPMADYVGWRREDGLPFDGWLRVHERLGGDVLHLCPHSMRIPGTIAQWTEWTGQIFPGSGDYIIDGALVPIQIDVEDDTGLYIEPNVWVLHRLTPKETP